jgi:hypothetical protein
VAGQTAEANAITQSGSAPSRSDRTVSLTLDAAGEPDDLVVRASSGASLGSWTGAQITCGSPNCTLVDSDDSGTLVNPTALGWSYQTFGYWVQDPLGTRQTTVFSTGSPTPSTATLSVATATYNGSSGGIYVEGADIFEHRADMTADVDFGSRSIDFRTTNTQMGALGGTGMSSASQLDMTGTLSIDGSYQFTGSASTANSLDSTISGRFYGSDAQEIGGVFNCGTCPAGTNFTGAFGGKR